MDTIDYYNINAKEYFNQTNNINMDKQYEFFLKYMPKSGKILDFGCGSGRDSVYFKNLGYDVDSIDGSRELCILAKKYNGVDAKCMGFYGLDSIDEYDGVWACSSLLHLNRRELLPVLRKISEALKSNGYFYTSFKDGNSVEVYKDGRLYNFVTLPIFESFTKSANLEMVDYYQNVVESGYNKGVVWNNFVLTKKK